VTTDTLPQLPILSIVSPTPRAFTFPITHNFSAEPNSPYSSPSHSPFEPDLHSSTLSSSSCITPPPHRSLSILRTLSPDVAFRSSSPSPSSSHKRRKSSCSSSDLGDRRPKKGDEDYIKRPENAFILFRRKCCEDRQAALEEASSPSKKQRQADLSKTISQQWKGLSADERQYWEHLAKEKKKEHELKYPDYVYRPQRAKDKDGRPKPRKHKRGDVEEEADNITVGVPNVHYQRHHGRSLSAPTPPPYQTIQIPNVYQMTPSCPTSPSLLPMISRRSSHPDYAEDPLSQFDYIPNDNFSFGQAGQLEASLQVRFLKRDRTHVLNSCFTVFRIPTKHVQHVKRQRTVAPTRNVERVHAPSAAQYRLPIALGLLGSLFANLRPFLAAIGNTPAFCPSDDFRRVRAAACANPGRARPPDGATAAARVCRIRMGDQLVVAHRLGAAPQRRLQLGRDPTHRARHTKVPGPALASRVGIRPPLPVL